MKKIVFLILFLAAQVHAEQADLPPESAEKAVPAVATMAAASSEETASSVENAIALKDESQIPLKLTAEKKSESSDSTLQKFMLGLFVLTVMLAGVYFLIRKYSLKNIKSDLHQIKILTQHHLGPKKSLAIIRVAGESILVGITDHNISMIKSLSLLDEDIPQDTPQKFDQTLFQVEKKSDEEFTIKGIHEHVRTKLKEMKGFS